MSLTGVLNTHMIAALLIGLHGSDEQRDRLLPEMASGRARGALSLSESDAGSDTRALRCQATRDGDEYVLNGTKMWVTNGLRSRVVALAARTAEGITCFIVEKEPGLRSGGIEVSRHIDKLGYRGVETVEMTYVDHRVPADAVLGGAEAPLGQGLPQMLGALELGRVNVAARGVGVARAAFEAAISYAQQRQAFGVPIARHQAIAFKLADMGMRVEAARLLTRSAAEKARPGRAGRRGGRHGQALRLGGGLRERHRSHADPRRLRLHHRRSGRALLPGRSAPHDRRGHQRDSADGYCPPPARALRRGLSGPRPGRRRIKRGPATSGD